MTDEPVNESEPEDPAWIEVIDKPATRGELLQVLQMMMAAQLSQSAFGVALIDGDEATQRKLGEASIDRVLNITRLSRTMVDRWKLEL